MIDVDSNLILPQGLQNGAKKLPTSLTGYYQNNFFYLFYASVYLVLDLIANLGPLLPPSVRGLQSDTIKIFTEL